MSASNPKVVVDHEGDLSFSWKPILFLGFLLLEADILLEVRILDDLTKQKQFSHPACQILESPFHKLIARISIRPMNRSSLLLWSTTQPPMQKSEQAVTWFFNLIFQHKDVEGVGNLSNWSSGICCLCCPTIVFCGISTGNNELMADGLLANVGIGTVPFFRSSPLTTRVPSPICIGTDPAAPGVVEWWIPWWWFRDESNVEQWLPKAFSLWSRRIPCIEWQAFLVDHVRSLSSS